MLLMLQSTLPGFCACSYLIGQHGALTGDVALLCRKNFLWEPSASVLLSVWTQHKAFVCCHHQNSKPWGFTPSSVGRISESRQSDAWRCVPCFPAQRSSPNVAEGLVVFSAAASRVHHSLFYAAAEHLLFSTRCWYCLFASQVSQSERSSNTQCNRTRRSPPRGREAQGRKRQREEARKASGEKTETRGTILPVSFSNVVVCEELRNTM